MRAALLQNRPKTDFGSDPQHLDRFSLSGREVVDTAFGAIHSCGRAEEVYPPYARTDGTGGRLRVRGESANSAGR